MEIEYRKILDFMLESGKRLATRTGNIADIGITKKDLTEEDLAIERGLKKIIESFGSDHTLFAEEENDMFKASKNIWVADPISGTSTFIKGLPHYSIVVAHLINQEIMFAAVYDPSADELFTAYKGKGSFLNGKPIKVAKTPRIILRVSGLWRDQELISRVKSKLDPALVDTYSHSMAVDYCSVACGRWSGIVSFTKDTFPEFAGSFIIREAGGRFTNLEGEVNFKASDRMFVAGNPEAYEMLFPLIKSAL